MDVRTVLPAAVYTGPNPDMHGHTVTILDYCYCPRCNQASMELGHAGVGPLPRVAVYLVRCEVGMLGHVDESELVG